jgi:urease accessory protein
MVTRPDMRLSTDATDPDIPLPLLRLLSASLPVGAFAYSRGLEYAVHQGWVADEASLRDWVFGTLEHTVTPLDGALFLRMMAALDAGDGDRFAALGDWLAAGRESRELQLEDRRMAEALITLLTDLGVPVAAQHGAGCMTFPGAFALAAHDLGVRDDAALAALMWGFCDAQVAAGIRLGAIGQTGGQRILAAVPALIGRCIRSAATLGDDEIGNLSVMLALGSALHETQESRLFRS